MHNMQWKTCYWNRSLLPSTDIWWSLLEGSLQQRSTFIHLHTGDRHGPISGYSSKIASLTSERIIFCLRLDPWNKNVDEKLSHPDKNLPFFYATRRFNNMLTTARYMSPSWARSIHCKPSKIFYKINFNIVIKRMFSALLNKKCCVRWAPCYHGMARFWIPNGEITFAYGWNRLIAAYINLPNM